MIDEAISRYWKMQIEEEALNKTSTSLMNQSYTDKPHLLWHSTASDPRDIRRACINAKMLAGVYILQKNRKAFKQTHDTM